MSSSATHLNPPSLYERMTAQTLTLKQPIKQSTPISVSTVQLFLTQLCVDNKEEGLPGFSQGGTSRVLQYLTIRRIMGNCGSVSGLIPVRPRERALTQIV